MDETAGPLPPRLLGITTFVLAQVGRAGRVRMGRMMDEHGLGLWHFAVLSALDDAAPASQRDLGARLRIDPSDLVEVVGRLEGRPRPPRARPGRPPALRGRADRAGPRGTGRGHPPRGRAGRRAAGAAHPG
ncbi:MarR family winged helix-turn-helix transcriptional regulator [Actinomadura luteofluorescens]|uniref:MarR family winged helix-turn-helix transcriptional regulator n=1 Tax=Actinomadura luteofluorescens TaxID=46163 RepID=UPI003631D845